MLFSLASTVFGLVALTQAVDHAVVVGGPGILAYNPPSVSAAVGDTVTFTFQQKNHTITQSSFESPCTAVDGGFDSGFQPVSPDDTTGPFPAATITIQDTTPIWIFCRQQLPSPHCAAGMVFAINPGDGQLATFQAAAKATGGADNATVTAVASTASETSSTPTASSTATATSVSPSSTSTVHTILVGDGGVLAYNPPNITAQIGDTITFQFRAKNHTISQSSFGVPCRLLAATSGTPGFDSGFMPVAANGTDFPSYSITVNDTNPIWAYCRQTNPTSHCGAGMVFAANAVESGANNFEAFTALAKHLNGTNSTSSPNAASGTARQGIMALTVLALVVAAVV